MITDERKINMSGSAVTPTDRGKGLNVTLWIGQALLAAFFILASALPKLAGTPDMVDLFNDIGIGQWFRYVVGVLELAGGIGLLISRLAGLASLGLAGLMIGAGLTQAVVLNAPAMATTPIIFFVLFALISWGRWPRTRALLGR
jgi:putative oxidoreductase